MSDQIPKYYVVAIYPDGRRERVVCGKAKEVKPFAKKIAIEHAKTYYTQHHVATDIELEKT